MKAIFLLLFFLCSLLAFSQQIDITVRKLNTERAVLSLLSGETVTQFDTITSSDNGRFLFSLKPVGTKVPTALTAHTSGEKNHSGFYRLSFDNNRWIDFINDNEDVAIITDAENILDSMKVLSSESNGIYYSFQKLNKQYKTKTELLQLVLARYPKEDSYYKTTQATIGQLQKEYSEFINSAQRNPDSFTARYIYSSQAPIVDFNVPPDKQLAYLKSHALESVNFNDEDLVNSDVFTNKAIEYLMYYRNPQLPKEILEKEFNVAVDTILNKAKVNQVVYQHLTKYLIDGFKKYGFEKCINYILDNYVIEDDLCLDEQSGSSIQRMIEQKKNLPIGSLVPNITLPDSSGNILSLLFLNAEKILILFYSSSCPHCRTMIPMLHEYYSNKKQNGFEVLAISFDEIKNDWLNFIKTNNLRWVNVNDSKGWAGDAASDYFIYATPTMFLVDKEKKIIAKPLTVEDLQKLF
ncbi:MAG: TlpA family protein disulfide reductase [Ignavibacteriales bacterium]|nr:TlpA family protein disulfide reductase [Ignavibacteriales bacterium]